MNMRKSGGDDAVDFRNNTNCLINWNLLVYLHSENFYFTYLTTFDDFADNSIFQIIFP